MAFSKACHQGSSSGPMFWFWFFVVLVGFFGGGGGRGVLFSQPLDKHMNLYNDLFVQWLYSAKKYHSAVMVKCLCTFLV